MAGGFVASVVVVDRDTVSRGAIKDTLAKAGAKVVGEAESLASGLSLVNGLRPDILILELPRQADQALEAVRGLKQDMPDMGIIIAAGDSSPQLILRSMRAGAQEFLTRPLDARELSEAVRRLASMAKRTGGSRKPSGKIISVFSSKGGVGVTSVAINLAVSLATTTKKKTVIVDLNMQMGDVGLLLDLRPRYTITDAVGSGTLDESRLKGLLTEHDTGVMLLSAPEDPIEAAKISPGVLLEVFSLLKSMFDVVVVDAGHFFDNRVLEILSLADTILVVSVLDVPTVRNVRRCLTLLRQLGYSDEKVRLVVNRFEKKTKVTVEDLEETAETSVFWRIPNDYKTLIAAIDAGVPAVVQSTRSKMSRSIEDLARELVSMHGQTATPTGSPETAESVEPNQRSAGR